jgi:hypothetical protein
MSSNILKEKKLQTAPWVERKNYMYAKYVCNLKPLKKKDLIKTIKES